MSSLVGIYWFELTWEGIERVRKGQEECWQEFPMFRRIDMHQWSRSKFYLGAIFLLTPRLIFSFGCVFVAGIIQRLLFIGRNMEEPLDGWRRKAQQWTLWIICPLCLWSYGYNSDVYHLNKDDVDYSKYLGPNWKEQEFKGKRVSTVVSNHINTVVEILTYLGKMPDLPSFTPAHFIKNFPIGDFYTRALQSIYIDRTSSDEARNETVRTIVER